MNRSFAEMLHGGPIDLEEVERVSETLIFERVWRGAKFFKFACLLVLAASIATFGLLGDSVAVIIGAMIVAPLMLPIMGLAFSVSIGDQRKIISTMLVSFAGIAMAIAVGFILTLPIAKVTHPEAIQQIMIRTSPHLLDLMAALATGFAGAFALSRKDVSDTLPGVAIAVSLVPPLANVGILLALGEPKLAAGSLLLFVTNYVSILLTGSLVFVVMGFRQVATSPFDPRARRRAVTIALIALIIIVIPLSLSSYNLIVANKISARAYTLAQEWLDGSGYQLLRVDAETADGTVNLLLLGEGEIPPLSKFQEQAKNLLFGRTIRVKVVESQIMYIDK
ncbi:TIGR00341 family protein [Cyanobacterium sp. Dongsha4]|uniref:TIGR00341 family protein n=1 Tax=Cyanobacterium sp. DS4 TaxID=2878255 RepID=UPI002E821705|nr:TIGR00341 family protein [Cyanobacterium sp. Dongsha4]WVK99722.1 TIGR00341 family protein [Cyanobacterium sp. Dongsha4]